MENGKCEFYERGFMYGKGICKNPEDKHGIIILLLWNKVQINLFLNNNIKK